MSIRCAARFTMRLKVPGEDKTPTITFRCEREAHEDNEHFTTGKGGEGQKWEMSWNEIKIGDGIKEDKDKSIH